MTEPVISAALPQPAVESRVLARPWQRLLLLVGLAWAFAVVVPDFYRVSAPLATLGFEADNSGVIYRVDQAQATVAGQPYALHLDDRIVLSPGACWHPTSLRCRNYLAVFGGMGGLTYVLPGTVATLTIAAAAGTEPAQVTVTARPQALDVATKVVLALDEIAAIIVLWLAFRLAWDSPSRMTVGFFLFAMWFNPGQYFVLYAWLQHQHPILMLTQETLQAIAQGAGYAGFLVFALWFPHGRRAHRLRNIERVAIAVGVALALLQLASFLNVFGLATEVVTRLAVLGGYAVAVLAFIVVRLRLRYQSPLDHQRMRWVLWGCAIGIPAFIVADSNEATSLWVRYVWNSALFQVSQPEEWAFELGFLLSGVLTIFICTAVRHRRIVSVTPELRALMAGFVVLVIGVVIEVSLHDPVHAALDRWNVPEGGQFYLAIVPLVICSAAVHRGAHAVDHFFNLDFYRARKALESAAEAAEQTSDESSIDEMLVRTPIDALDIAAAAVFREATGSFARVASSPEWDESLMDPASTAFRLLIEELRKGEAVVVAPPAETGLGASDDAIGNDAIAPALAVPVIFTDQLYAVAAYGAHRSGAALDTMEVEELRKFARKTAVGYERLEVQRLRQHAASVSRSSAG